MKIRATLMLLLLTVACSYNHAKHQDEPEQLDQGQIDNPDFAAIKANILVPRCYSCHSKDHGNAGSLNLETYDSVKSHLVGGKGIQVRVLGLRDMPPGAPVGAPFDQMLRNWISNDAPLVVTARQDNDLLTAANDFARVRDHIFVAHHCTDCHGDFKPMADLNLLDYEQAKAKIRVMIDRFVFLHNHPPDPYPAISHKEKWALLQWADAGTPK